MREYVYVEYRHLENTGYGVGFFFFTIEVIDVSKSEHIYLARQH